MIFGIDTSYANGEPNWPQALRDSRTAFVIARVCYGVNPIDDDDEAFVEAHDAAKAAGRPFGAYAFWIAGQDGKAQAEHFLQKANGRFGTIAPALDIEEGSGVEGWGGSVEERVANVAAWLDTVQAHCGQPMIYTNPDTWKTYFGGTDAFAGHRLWLAEYGVAPGEARVIPGFKELVIHQYSDGAGETPIVGLSHSENNVDRDVLLVSFEEIGRR